MPKMKKFEREVSALLSDTLQETADRLLESLHDLEALEARLTEALDEVKTKREIIERAVSDFGTP